MSTVHCIAPTEPASLLSPSMTSTVLALTGTRADYGKLKPLLLGLEQQAEFDLHVAVTGMHMMKLYGHTYKEVQKDKFLNIYPFVNQYTEEPMESVLGNTLQFFSRLVREVRPDFILVHGDRVEALAGTIAGALANIRVIHIEGGERSGTIDDAIRHSISKLAHVHLVANEEAKKRLLRMGENDSTIHVIGSPDLDIMASPELPSIISTKDFYELPFENYAIAMFHPVTTEYDVFKDYAENFFNTLKKSHNNYLTIFPNNDLGSKYIIEEIAKLKGNKQFRVLPSIRFESFLVLLKHADFIIGNSSAGLREAPFYDVPTVNVGTRQNMRYMGASIFNTDYTQASIQKGIDAASQFTPETQDHYFGSGTAAANFMKLMDDNTFYDVPIQKVLGF